MFHADEDASAKPMTFEPDEDLAEAEARIAPVAAEPQVRKGPTPEQITAIKAAIANAATLEEMQRLEAALKTGHLPSEVVVGNENGEVTAMEEG